MGEAKRRKQADPNFGKGFGKKSEQEKFVIRLGEFFDVSHGRAFVNGTVDEIGSSFTAHVFREKGDIQVEVMFKLNDFSTSKWNRMLSAKPLIIKSVATAYYLLYCEKK